MAFEGENSAIGVLAKEDVFRSGSVMGGIDGPHAMFGDSPSRVDYSD